jgi:hypothetical protein
MNSVDTNMFTWSGVILGWFAVPLMYVVTTTLLTKYTDFYKRSYNKWYALYVFIGMIISTLVTWIDLADPNTDLA